MSALYFDKITADSTPVLDGWGWDDYWDSEDWIQWYKLLLKKYGSYNKKTNYKKGEKVYISGGLLTAKEDGYLLENTQADTIWLSEWNKQSFGANPTLDIYKNKEIIRFLIGKKIGFDSNILQLAGIPIGLIPSTMVVVNTEDAIENAVSGFANILKIIKYSLIAIVGLAILGGAAYVYKSFKDTDIDINLGGKQVK